MCESLEEEYGTPKVPYRRNKEPVVKADAKYRDMVKQIESRLHSFRLEIDGLLRESEGREKLIQEQADTITVQREAIRLDAETIEDLNKAVDTNFKTIKIQREIIEDLRAKLEGEEKKAADRFDTIVEIQAELLKIRSEFSQTPFWKDIWRKFIQNHWPFNVN